MSATKFPKDSSKNKFMQKTTLRIPFQLLYVYLLFLPGCNYLDQAQEIVDKSIQAHWGQNPNYIQMNFDFREIHYELKRDKEGFEYSRQFQDSLGLTIKDVLSIDTFYRTINGEKVDLSDTKKTAYSNSVNSVMYFMLLPIVLNDDAVNKNYIGEVTVKDKPYYLLEVSFQEEGGGEDFDDVYLYWINKETYLIDYLAYEFHVDGGGKRFREAYNKREVNGVIIQDYVNYEADEVEDLYILDNLFEQGKLEKLSEIENKSVEVNFTGN